MYSTSLHVQYIWQHPSSKQVKLMWTPENFYSRYKVDESRDQGKLKSKPSSNNYVIKEEISIPIRKMINSNCNI